MMKKTILAIETSCDELRFSFSRGGSLRSSGEAASISMRRSPSASQAHRISDNLSRKENLRYYTR